MADAGKPASGSLLNGRWRLCSRLGQGGQGRTYVARDESVLRGERLVAVKEIRLDEETGWKKFDLFEREARVLQQLTHPAIPRCLDRFEVKPDRFYLVMELAPGETLRTLASRGRFSEAQLRDLLGRTLDILIYLHGRRPPVIHRDIKPDNLVRAEDGAISLVDFGGVRDVLREDGGSTVVGTFGYMAPEQLHGQATSATDLYGLGATAVALASGVEPEKIPRRGLRMDLRRPLAGLSPGLVALIEQMVEPDPERRPASAVEARRLLDRLERDDGPGPELEAEAEGDREVDDLGTLPRPLGTLMHVLFVGLGTAGYLGLTIFQIALLPMIFALIGAFSSAERRPRLKEVQRHLHHALDEGRRGFRGLSQRYLPRRRRHRALSSRR